MTTKINKQWRLVARPQGLLKESDFELKEESIPALDDGQVLVRSIYLSLDPANRGWVNAEDTYLPAVELGAVMRGIALGVVEESKNPEFTPGEFVQGMMSWQTYSVLNGKDLIKIPHDGSVPLTAYLGLLGMVGLTAYFGLLDVGQPKEGETLVVSAAAGAVGSIVGQIGKIKGCRVVGIAGTDEKCNWITEDLGFDAAINYKKENVLEGLKKHCPDGIDIYFENVGGQILDDVLSLVNIGARIPVCGLISQYNATKPMPGPYNFSNILIKRVRVEGFIILDYEDRFMEGLMSMMQWLAEGKLKYRVHVVEGLENAPSALNMLFDGSNKGKLIVKVSDEG